MRRPVVVLAAVIAVLLGLVGAAAALVPASASPPAPSVLSAQPTDADDDVVIHFFWGDGCPHCAAAEPFLADLAERYDATVVDHELWYHPENQGTFEEFAAAYGFEPTGVPVIVVGEEYWVGFAENPYGPQIEAAVAQCAAEGCPDPAAVADGTWDPDASTADGPGTASDDGEPAAGAAEVLSLPLVGDIDLGAHSLVVSTALIALVDGFNPCSLWVLSVLLALTLHSGSRRTTLIIGLVFIGVTAFIYALFIAGLFTVFQVVGMAPWLRVLVAAVALLFAVVNIKDYFWFRKGLSFTIADERKPGIYRGIRRVLATDSLPALVGATVALAAGVSLVEFSCTAGFPVLWTNLLSSQGAGVGTFLVLLVLYMLIYQLDELVIFGTAVVTLRASKLQEQQGRALKLVGGMLMLTLAVVMIVDPTLMSSVGTSLVVFGIALGATALVLVIDRVVLPWLGVRRPAHGAADRRTTGRPSTSRGATTRRPVSRGGRARPR